MAKEKAGKKRDDLGISISREAYSAVRDAVDRANTKGQGRWSIGSWASTNLLTAAARDKSGK